MSSLMNMYDEIRANLHFNKFAVGELLFVEYKCPIEQEAAGVWTPMDYFVHVLSGRKTWRTAEGSWTLEKGDTLFFKKGACVVLTVAMPLIMSVYVGIAEKAAEVAIDHVRRKKTAKPATPYLIGEMNNDLVAAEVQLSDMLRIANNYDFEPVDQNGHDILTRKTNVANAAIRVVIKAMEIVGGEGFYRGFGLERSSATCRRRAIIRCRKAIR